MADVLKIVRIQEHDFDVGEQWQRLREQISGTSGAMAAFCGLVRDRLDADDVTGLELEHYPGMTERTIERVIDRAAARWPLEAVLVIHRVGPLEPRDQIVLVITTSAHRHAAFESAAFVMDHLKTDAVFWKKERLGETARWITSTASDRDRVEGWSDDD